MKTRKLYFTILVFLILFSTFFGIILLNGSLKDENNYNTAEIEYLNNEVVPKSSNGALNQYLIFQNVTTVRRGFEAINFTINASEFTYADNAKMRIDFSNNSHSIWVRIYPTYSLSWLWLSTTISHTNLQIFTARHARRPRHTPHQT